MTSPKNWKRVEKTTGKDAYTAWRHKTTNDLIQVKRIPSNPDDIGFGEIMATPKSEEDALRHNWILQKPTYLIPDSERQRTGFNTREEAEKAAVQWMRKHSNLVEIRARNSERYREDLKENAPEQYREIFVR
jgi:hypothetical protein